MNQQQENRLNMFYAAQGALNLDPSIWNGVAAMVTVVGEFEQNIAAIEDKLETQVKDITGYTTEKANALEAMIAKTLEVGGAVMSYAEANGKAGLAEEMNVVSSELRGYRDAIVAQRSQGVHATATANLAALATYGIAAADLTDLQAKITTYKALIAAPRLKVTERKGATSSIGILIRDTMRLLDRRLDMLVRGFSVSHPEFFANYTNARSIVDNRGAGEAGGEVVNG